MKKKIAVFLSVLVLSNSLLAAEKNDKNSNDSDREIRKGYCTLACMAAGGAIGGVTAGVLGTYEGLKDGALVGTIICPMVVKTLSCEKP